MTKYLSFLAVLLLFIIVACNSNKFRQEEYVAIPDFNFPKSTKFKENLSEYKIFKGTPADLLPSKDFHLLELSSKLFTDYAHKQRLVKLPKGTKVEKLADNSVEFPNGTDQTPIL